MIGAPGSSESEPGAGRLIALSGESGLVAQRLNGGLAGMALGSAFSAVDDLDGDGDMEYAIGIPGDGSPAQPGRVVIAGMTSPSRLAILGPAAEGTMSGSCELLLINGSGGGVDHRVIVPIGSQWSVTMQQPPGRLTPARFVIYGWIGATGPQTTTALPFGLGSMVFPPCGIALGLPGIPFELANSFGPAGCGAIFPSTPTPWSLTYPAGISAAIQVSYQGLIEDAQGALAITNAVQLIVE